MVTPVVSVCITTYNHERFISKCLDSVLNQKTNFSFEIIIGEDESKDRTREIVLEYKSKYPDKIKLILNSRKNVFYFNGYPTGQNNFISVLKSATGRFIAMMDGDDFWTNEDKLQLQVDFLESNPEYAGCFHNSVNVDESGTVIRDKYFTRSEQEYDQEAALKVLKSSYSTSSLVFRRIAIDPMPKWFLKRTTDYALDLLITEFGKLGYIDRVMSAYRIHPGGVWMGKSHHTNMEDLVYRYLIFLSHKPFKRKYQDYIRNEINLLSGNIIKNYKKHRARRMLARFLIRKMKYKIQQLI